MENLKPTRVRYRVLWMAVLVYAITYLDRVCIAAAAPAIRAEFDLSLTEMGLIFSAFSWSYASFQIPGGYLGDRYGPRRVLAAMVIWWSVFTSLTAFAWNAVSMAVIRFLFGVGEAGAFPTATRAFSRWLPATMRGLAQGITHTGSRLGGAITPPLVVLIMSELGWRAVFIIFGLAGIVWAMAWYVWYRDRPEEHPAVNRQELEIINSGRARSEANPTAKSKVPWRLLLGNFNLWLLGSMYFCYGYCLWVYLSWFPSYLVQARGFELIKSGIYASLPLFAGAVTNSLGGWLSDRICERTGNTRLGRRVVAVCGFLICFASMLFGALAQEPIEAIILLTLAAAALELTTGVSWAIPLDIGQEYAGTVSAFMNTLGNLGGALSPIAFAFLVQQTGSWTQPFIVASAMCLLAAIFYLKIDPTESIFERR